MSKALIVLENHFFLDSDNNVWCDRVVDYNYLRRYLSVFDEIIVTGRTQIIDKITDNKLLVSGSKVEFVPMPDFKGAKGLIKNIFKLKKIIREQIKKCDCAIYRAPTHLSLFTYKEVIKAKKPLGIEFMMAANKMFDGNSILYSIFNKLVDKKAKKICLKADAVSYVTESILQKEYPCRAIKESNNNSFYTTTYSSIDLTEDMYYKQNWKEKPEVYNIIHTGYMDSYRKGQDILIKALKIVLDNGYNVTLTLVGDGEKKTEFESLTEKLSISNKVIFKGLIKDKKQVLELLRKSHMLVFPTQSEGLPRTIIEAMSQGLVCVASPVDGIPELLDEEYLVNYDDVEGYAKRIMSLLDNWEKMKQISLDNYNKSIKYRKDFLDKKRKDFYSFLDRKGRK